MGVSSSKFSWKPFPTADTARFYKIVQKPPLLCSAKTNTTTPGKLGRAVGFSTRASRAGVGFYTTLQVYCNWFLSDFTLLSVSIYLF